MTNLIATWQYSRSSGGLSICLRQNSSLLKQLYLIQMPLNIKCMLQENQ